MRYTIVVLAGFFSMFAHNSVANAGGDAELGAAVFKKKCASCHALTQGAHMRVGPHLQGIVNAPAGQVEGFAYSAALNKAGSAGVRWSPDQLDKFLESPRAYLQKTKMNFSGIKKPEERANLIAYLAAVDDEQDAQEDASLEFAVPAPLLALEGDWEYGEYLSSECLTCHQSSGGGAGIPMIKNKPFHELVTALYAYREGFRENQVMQLIAKRLEDEEIVALARYFETIDN